MEINPESLSIQQTYKLLIGTVMPRPIAWVSTVDSKENLNLAPFSFFTVASVNPPILCFSPLLTENSSQKDTLVNIRETGEFVVNVVSHSLAEKMNRTSAPYPSGDSEFVVGEVTANPSTIVKPPRVAESLVNFECKKQQIISLGSEPMAGNLIMGKVCFIHIHQEILRNGQVDSVTLDPIGRLWGNMYATIRDRFEIKRPQI